MVETQLRPTIWRTCRVLANEKRLELLSLVLKCPAGRVSQIANAADLPEKLAGQYLRMLQARGLLSAERESRFVMYSAEANPSISEAKSILAAMRTVLIKERQSPTDIISTLTGFTHPRRLTIIHELKGGPLLFGALLGITAISKSAMHRHLAKLANRGIVSCDDPPLGLWRFVRQKDPLAKALVACCS